MYFSLPNIINPICIQQLAKIILQAIQNTVGICMQTTILTSYQYEEVTRKNPLKGGEIIKKQRLILKYQCKLCCCFVVPVKAKQAHTMEDKEVIIYRFPKYE
jgi:hypothetical protein